MRRTAPKKSAAASGEGRGALAVGKEERNATYRSTDATSTGATVETPAAKDRRPWLGRDLTEWLSAVRATVRDADAGKVPHSMMTVAYSIALFTDHREGTAYRAYPDLAADTGLSLKTIGALVRLLEAHGHLETTRTATVGRAKQYRLTIPNVGGRDAELRKLATSIQEGELRKLATCIQAKEAEVIEEVPGHISGSLEGELRKLATTNKDKDIGLDRDATRPNINSTYTPTVDARACAPEGATAASDSSDATDTPGDPPPVEAYDDVLPFEEQYDGDEGTPHPNGYPSYHAAEDYSEGEHAEAARPPVEDDDHIDFDLADEAEPEPDPVRPPSPQVTITEAERRVLRTIVGSVFQDGTDPKRCWVWAHSANPDGETDPFDETGNFARVLASVVRKGLAAVRHNEGTDDEVRITAEGMAVFQEQHGRGGATAEATESDNAKPIFEDDDHIPF